MFQISQTSLYAMQVGVISSFVKKSIISMKLYDKQELLSI